MKLRTCGRVPAASTVPARPSHRAGAAPKCAAEPRPHGCGSTGAAAVRRGAGPGPHPSRRRAGVRARTLCRPDLPAVAGPRDGEPPMSPDRSARPDLSTLAGLDVKQLREGLSLLGTRAAVPFDGDID